MSINPLSPNLIHLFNNIPIKITEDKFIDRNSSFKDILTDSLNAAGQADKIDKGSSLELLMGESDDLAGLLIDMQKAELSLQLALQIRNKIIDAYTEVMRMSV